MMRQSFKKEEAEFLFSVSPSRMIPLQPPLSIIYVSNARAARLIPNLLTPRNLCLCQSAPWFNSNSSLNHLLSPPNNVCFRPGLPLIRPPCINLLSSLGLRFGYSLCRQVGAALQALLQLRQHLWKHRLLRAQSAFNRAALPIPLLLPSNHMSLEITLLTTLALHRLNRSALYLRLIRFMHLIILTFSILLCKTCLVPALQVVHQAILRIKHA